MRILSIETSCDETSAAIVEGDYGRVKTLSNIVSSQIDIHKRYGGVVPEVAARNHILNIIPVVDEALRKAGRGGSIDLIAVTGGPGLMSSLLIGAQTAETLAYVWKKPLMVVNHIEGHIYANWLKPVSGISNSKFLISKMKFPALALVVSGGHTQLVLMRDHLKYKTIGQTRDDAAGEAFDKVAKILDLGYPGGPVISEMTEEYLKKYESRKASQPCSRDLQRGQWSRQIRLPRPMIDSDNFDFSFSGLKTAVLYLVRDSEMCCGRDTKFCVSTVKLKKKNDIISAICAEFQQAVVDVLIYKTVRAAQKYKVRSVLLSGGVAANWELRRQLKEAVRDELGDNIIFSVPEQNLCTDNAAMVGVVAYYRYKAKPQSAKMPPVGIKVDPNWTL